MLQKVQQSTDIGKEKLENVEIIRNCKKCPVYDELDAEITQLKLKGDGTI